MSADASRPADRPSPKPYPRSLPDDVGAGAGGGTGAASGRAAGARARGRLRGLLDVYRAVGAERGPNAVLARVLQSARELLGSASGAAALITPDGAFVPVAWQGMDAATATRLAAAGAPVEGGRHRDTREDAHRTFLRAPVLGPNGVLGELYLQAPDRPSLPEEDGDVLAALGAMAGAAIATTRQAEDAHRHRAWRRASGAVIRAMLAEDDLDTLLDVIGRALSAADADLAAVLLPDESGQLRACVTVGLGADKYRDLAVDTDWLHELTRDRTGLLQSKVDSSVQPGFDNTEDFGPMMLVPMSDAQGVRGAIVFLRTTDRPAFTGAELEHAAAFADHATLALTMDDTRNDADWMRVLEERNAVTADLHDNVLQRLFATGMGLQGLAAGALPTSLSERLTRHISDLDATIDEIRDRVFGTHDEVDDGPQRVHTRFPRLSVPAVTDGVQQPPDDEESSDRTPPRC